MTPKKTAIFSSDRLILLILYLIPILGVCGFVSYFSVNVPLYDQWILPYWFEKFSTGDLTLKNLFAQHNTHRIFFPKLIFIALSFVSNWNIRWELYFSILLAILTFFALYRLSQNTAQSLTQTSFHLINVSTCFLLFSWVQHENWLWGFQTTLFFINLCVVLSCLVLSSEFIQPRIKLIISAILCGFASFSSAQGLLSWLAITPSVFTLEQSRKQKLLVIWLSLFLFSILIYSIGYRQETDTVPDPVQSEHKLLAILHFFLNLIAAPFMDSSNLIWVMGLIIVLAFFGLILWSLLLFKKTQLNQNLSAWISIGLFAFLCSALIAVGRSGLGAEYAISASRYTTHIILLPIAIIQLSQRMILYPVPKKIKNFNLNKFLFLGCLIGLFLGLNLVTSANVVTYVQSRVPFIKAGKTCFYLIDYLEQSDFFKTSSQSCLLKIHSAPWIEVIWDSVDKLKRLNFRTFAQNVAFINNPKRTYGEIPSDQVFNLLTTESVKLKGWIKRSPSQNNPALILFSLADQPSFFANTYAVDFNSPPFNSNKFSSEQPLNWQVEFSADFLPLGTSIIQAWIYDSTENQFVKLNHQVTLTVLKSQPSEQ